MDQEKEAYSILGSGRVHKVAIAVLMLLAVFLISKTVSEIKGWKLIGKDIPPQTTITVSGKGEVVVKPDIATFSFSVSEESLVVGEAQDKVAKFENDIIDFLKKNKVDADDIKVSGYNIYPRYEYPKMDAYGAGGKRILAAYVVSESIEVKVRKIDDAGKIIGQLGELGATDLSGLNFSVDKQEEVAKEARVKAIADAQTSAKSLAKDLGVSLVRIVSFSENGLFPGPIYYAKAESMSAYGGDGIATPELPSGTNKITSNVSITYEIR